ncbi:MAG: hypothetical protein JWO36_3458 [Myxococcales bacterium]|nr:hypothetical protein [Myxococcales bacterium]
MTKLLVVLLCAAACSQSPDKAPASSPSEPATSTFARGSIATAKFHSAALDVDKDYLVYLPADYAANPDKRYPVFYYLHGLTGDETNWVRGGELDRAADKLGLQAIVVMPDGDDGFYSDSPRVIDYEACLHEGKGLFIPKMQPRPKTCVRHHMYETYIVKDLIAEVDTKYRTIAKREARGIAGLSMGGFGALVLAMRHPELFAAAASHSGIDALLYIGPHPYVANKVTLVTDPKTWGTGLAELGTWVQAIFGADLASWKAHDPASLVDTLEPGKLALYLDCGTEDDFALQDGASYLHDLLLAKHYEHAFFLGPGAHNFGFWKPRLPDSLKFLRDHTAH